MPYKPIFLPSTNIEGVA